METVYLILPKGKGHYGELADKYDNITHKLSDKGIEVLYVTNNDMEELGTHIHNLLNEEEINIEDKLWLIKQYLNNIRIKKFEF